MTTKVIMSCDDNPYYLDFWPLVSRVWKERIGIDPVLIHIGHSDVDDSFGEVVSMKPTNHPIHTQAQMARLWYPVYEPDTLWITSDIDMFPISRTYWAEHSQPGDFDWKNLNTDLRNYFPLCYNVATSNKFREILNVVDDFEVFVDSVLITYNSDLTHRPENWVGEEMSNWSLDEIYSSNMICYHRDLGAKIEQPLRPGGFHDGGRINRTRWQYDPRGIEEEFYIDCHSLRPYTLNKDRVDELITCLLK